MNQGKPARAQSRDRVGRRRRIRDVEDRTRLLEELRHALLAPDRTRIERLEDRPPIEPRTVGDVLPEAVGLATTARERELAIALEPTVTRAVTLVARRRPDIYAEALAPTIGAAVKKAVADAIAVMLERFDLALERSLSVRGLVWRIEAKRTGRPFAEVAMLHTLAYRVEQVFLIHGPTALVLQHLVDPTLTPRAPDQVAAMLSAIDSFGHEAFGPMPAEEHLRSFELGELTVLVSFEAPLVLAAVVRGTPSAAIREELRDTLARVRVASQEPLASGFTGDVSRFEPVRPELEPLLRVERRRPPRRAALLLAVAAVMAVVLVGGIVARGTAAARRRRDYVAALAAEPGIVVERIESRHGRARVTGFRDPLAAPPEAVLERRRLPPASLDLAPFVSLDPRIVALRAKHALAPPAGVEMRIDGQRLTLRGAAPRAWIDDALRLARVTPGIETVEAHALRPQEALDALHAAASELEALVVSFDVRQADVRPDQASTVVRASDLARSAYRAATDARIGACLDVTGHTDASGTDEVNRPLGAERGRAVADRLETLGIDPGFVRSSGAGRAEAAGPEARRVTFRLDVDPRRDRPTCGGEP